MKKAIASVIGLMMIVLILFSGCVEEEPSGITPTSEPTSGGSLTPFGEIVKERATSFYILDVNAGETDYPTELYLGEPAEVIARIENNEHETVNYVLQVKLNDDLLESENVRLADGSKWEQKISFTPNQIGKPLKLEFLLFKDRVETEPYKAFQLLVSSEKDHDNVVSPLASPLASPLPAEILTPFYILDAKGTEEYHPTRLYLGEPEEVLVRIENNESKEINYILQTELDGRVIKTESKWLTHGSKWEQKISFTPDRVGDNQTLEFLLFKNRVSEKPYQYFHHLVSTEINYKNLEPLLRYGIVPLPQVREGYIPSQISEWTFASSGNLQGYSSRDENTSLPYSYAVAQYEALNKGDYGELWQNSYAQNEGVVVLSFNVRDSFKETSEDAKIITKQVLLNDELIWTDDVSGRDAGYVGWVVEKQVYDEITAELEWEREVPRVKSGWTRVDVPVYLLKGENKLKLVVSAKESADNLNVRVYWDDVELKSIGELVEVGEGVRMKAYRISGIKIY